MSEARRLSTVTAAIEGKNMARSPSRGGKRSRTGTPDTGYGKGGHGEGAYGRRTDTFFETVRTAESAPGVFRAKIDPAKLKIRGSIPSVAVTAARLSEQPTDIRDAARALSREFTAQVEELQRSKPNEPEPLAKYNDLVAFLEKMAAGLSKLANALDQAVNKTAEGNVEPAFLGTAAKVVRQLQLGAMEWLEKNRMTVFEVPFRIGLFGTGLTFVHALGFDSALVTTLIAGLALKQSTKSAQPEPKKKR